MDFKKFLLIGAIILVLCISISAISAKSSSDPVDIGDIGDYSINMTNFTVNEDDSNIIDTNYTLEAEIKLSDLDDDVRKSIETIVKGNDAIGYIVTVEVSGGKEVYENTTDASSLSLEGDTLTFSGNITLPLSYGNNELDLVSIELDTPNGSFSAEK